MNNPLLPPFQTQTWADWQARVRTDANDPTADQALRWQTPEGFSVEPYYTSDAVGVLPLADIQAAQKPEPGWLNTPLVRAGEQPDLPMLVAAGADAFQVLLSETTDLKRLLGGIKLSETPIFFRTQQPAPLLKNLKTIAPYRWRGGLLSDPVIDVLPDGLPGRLTTLAALTEATQESPRFRTLCVNGQAIEQAGGNATQQLGFGLASLAEQFRFLTDWGFAAETVAAKTLVSVAVGTSYFMEIAKLRAWRVLLVRWLTGMYNLNAGQAASLTYIHAQTSTFCDARATTYTNLLRATTEAMSAVMGGCDCLTVSAFDSVLGKPSAFSERLARNVSLLLKDESYLDKVADPAAGAYYIETLTHQLTEAAWTLFQSVEAMGGYTSAYGSGFILGEIDTAYQAQLEAIRAGKTLIGVTAYRHDEPHTPTPETPTEPAAGALPIRRRAAAFE